ncbi:C2 domain protein [Cooperia oncophora]
MVATAIHGIDRSTTEGTELLRVRVVKGERLGKRDLFGVVSPYCVVRLERADGEQIDEITLEKKKKTRDPVWNSIVTLRVTRQCCLKFLIFDENKIRKDALLGSVEFNLATENIGSESRPPSAYPLKGGRHRNIGNLWIGMYYLPSNQSPNESTSDLQVNDSMPEGISTVC